MRRTLLWALVLGLLAGAWSVCRAQDVSVAQDDPAKAKKAKDAVKAVKLEEAPDTVKPVLIVSFSGYDRAIKAAETVAKLANAPTPMPLAAMVDAAVKTQIGAEGLTAIDTKRPWGFVVQTDGANFAKVGFLPVTDLKKLLGVLEPKIGKAKDDGKGVFEINAKDQSAYLTQKDQWVFVSDKAEDLAGAPKDPMAVLGGLNESFDLGVRAVVKNVPPLMRQMVLMPLQMGMTMGAEKRPNESDEEFALRTKIVKQALQQITTLVSELDTFQVGLKVDDKASTVYLEYQIVAVEGTKTARQLSEAKETKSGFAGFFASDAALSVNVASKMAEPDAAQLKTTLAALRANALKELEKQDLPAADLKLAKQMIADLMDVLDKTIESGRFDAGAAVMLDANLLTLAGGVYLAETDKLDALLRKLVAQIPPDAAEIAKAVKLDAQTYEGVKLHTFSLPTSTLPDLGPLPQLVGESLDVVLGIGPQSFYLAAGRNAMKTLKEMIDKSKAAGEQVVPPARLSLAATPIAKAVAALGDEKTKPVAAQFAKLLEEASGKDHITMTNSAVPNGTKVRIEVEQGLFKLITPIIMARMGAAGARPGAPAPGAPPAPKFE